MVQADASTPDEPAEGRREHSSVTGWFAARSEGLDQTPMVVVVLVGAAVVGVVSFLSGRRSVGARGRARRRDARQTNL
ncbi:MULTISPECIES: hypothetical protein [Nonomuraea]|uniref:Uncharacterized protein n=1 Tax=Nonomuraea mangrovi TaxID=2316207 RepID=A0ABW4SW79_9ACTN